MTDVKNTATTGNSDGKEKGFSGTSTLDDGTVHVFRDGYLISETKDGKTTYFQCGCSAGN